ncbi:BadF/BadG/BcrA/BcrD ATPase family protein [Kitasatospora nipponensis]|uniref:BadF/BadG/BcrA/BcrD ATPase family protein n=1 Tax=Kitasatospora nipponensis TaxID=258049 RepID=A0ABP4H5T6_9ACTN
MTAEPALFLAVDGGNSKTDVLLGRADGHLLGRVRGGPFRPQVTGPPAALAALGGLLEALLARAGRPAGLPAGEPLGAPVGQLSAFVAGADLPSEEAELTAALAALGWARQVHAANDTFALLHAGARAGWGVAVVCGTGINCVGLGPDGTVARFPALGEISGDWGGGGDLGRAVLWHAVRAEDGRGPATTLAAAVAERFALPTVAAVTEALHHGRLAPSALHTLTRPLLAAATAGDPVARALLERQGDEITAMAVTALRRLDLLEKPAEVVLGGGVLAARHPHLARRVADGIPAAAPRAVLRTVTLPPVAGAALHALHALGTPADGARERLLRELADTEPDTEPAPEPVAPEPVAPELALPAPAPAVAR